ncbi:Uncharacterised protein [Mycobacterium tuberculosis]|nr:Uncharacterised protein [Mycobacterium tuberculosis]
MSSSSAPTGSDTVRTKEPYANSERPSKSFCSVRSALMVS